MPSDAAAARQDHRGDANEASGGVDQRTAGVAGIDRGVGLDEVLDGAAALAHDHAYDALRDRLPEAQRIADREHAVAALDILDVGDGDRL